MMRRKKHNISKEEADEYNNGINMDVNNVQVYCRSNSLSRTVIYEKQEMRTERFFSCGIERWDDYHNGYLNFGLWEENITDYLEAAQRLLERVGKMAGLNQDSVVLDVGCGMGSQDIFFTKNFKCKRIEAVDLTQKHIIMAKKRIKGSKYKDRINFSVGDACKLDFKKDSFTQVIGVEAPINFNTREKFFHDAFSFLMPDGRLGISDFYLKKRPETPLGQIFCNLCGHFWHIPKQNRYDLVTYEKKLKGAGFVDIELERVEDEVIPGYYSEQKRKDVQKSLARIRGWKNAKLSLLLDYVTYRLWKSGIAGYVLVSARKPS
jgi:ubiquinone/menaquinone biosynthesis C-methylase UbiE